MSHINSDSLHPDPFGTEGLRASVLRAWQDSPTRFIEDTNSERDLRVGGYRDRLFVELAQNAADAAAAIGERGALRVSLVDGELRVANTGALLDKAGVAALSSLRASAKPESAVGRFGVGFAAVLTVSREPRIVSRSGGVAFSEERTRQEADREGEVPVLRLLWPTSADEDPLPEGFDTEVRLPLFHSIDELLALAEKAVGDLLLSLPWLKSIEISGRVWTRGEANAGTVEITSPEGEVQRWLTHLESSCVWAIPVQADGRPVPLEADLLHAPTPTDERLSLPARLITSLPIDPSRRRVLAGDEVHEALRSAARSYPDLVRKVAAEYRLDLVPKSGFPLSEVDAELRELVVEALTAAEWVPAAGGGEILSSSARVLDINAPDLVNLVAKVIPRLVASPLCGPDSARVLALVGAKPLGIAELIDLLTGTDQTPEWWQELYEVLSLLLDAHVVDRDELGALPIQLNDGRTVSGPRDALIVGDNAELTDLLSTVDITGLRLVNPAVTHSLLIRLGAKPIEAEHLLQMPVLRQAVQSSVEDHQSGLDTAGLANLVLRLISLTGMRREEWFGALALPSVDEWRRADELVLPSSPLLDIFDPVALGEEGAFGVLKEEFAQRWPIEALRAVGVLDTFEVVIDDDPLEPDHRLPEEEEWWNSLAEPPSRLIGIRDLDLVSEDSWPDALRLLAARPETWAAWSAANSHARWWIARYAELAGHPPRYWRLPSVPLSGLLDPIPELDLPENLLVMAGVRTSLDLQDLEDAEDLLGRLADARREIAPGLVLRAHSALADVKWSPAELRIPNQVRVLTGAVIEADQALVLDKPWLRGACPSEILVAAEWNEERAHRLADLLDLPLGSEQIVAEVSEPGDYVSWLDLPAVGEVAEALDFPLPAGGLVLHEKLEVTVDGVLHTVSWWSGDALGDRLHAEDSPVGLARALAWAADRWSDRYQLAALLDGENLLD